MRRDAGTPPGPAFPGLRAAGAPRADRWLGLVERVTSQITVAHGADRPLPVHSCASSPSRNNRPTRASLRGRGGATGAFMECLEAWPGDRSHAALAVWLGAREREHRSAPRRRRSSSGRSSSTTRPCLRVRRGAAAGLPSRAAGISRSRSPPAASSRRRRADRAARSARRARRSRPLLDVDVTRGRVGRNASGARARTAAGGVSGDPARRAKARVVEMVGMPSAAAWHPSRPAPPWERSLARRSWRRKGGIRP